MAAVETWQDLQHVGKGGGGLEVHMNLMPPRVTKVSCFPILPGGFLWKA
jgi:hypothetical protein